MSQQTTPVGFLNIDKPTGWTSHDVVARVRRIVRERQVGHAGTLDPMATGVLLVCVGRATRLVEYVSGLPKVYRATVTFGVETDTWDAEGMVVGESDATGLTVERLSKLLEPFRGEIAQVPPMYSALKRDGQPLYRLARAGLIVEREPRTVRIDRLEIVGWDAPRLSLLVECSAGTYIRSLAYDLGQAAGTGAHLSALVRAAIGHFSLEQATTLDTLAEAGEGWHRWLIEPHHALRHLPAVTVTGKMAQDLGHGRSIELSCEVSGEVCCAYDASHRLIAVLVPEDRPGWWRPHKVLAPA